MQIESMKHFIELARAGSFYGAARGSFISHQGMNRAVTSLETELGTKLIERSRRGVRLTSDGEIFLKYAKRIAVDYDLMIDEITHRHSTVRDGIEPISVYVSYYAAQTAVANPSYVGMLAENLSYIEEPFEKLIKRAANSDGRDLVYLDLHANTIDTVLSSPDVAFEPIVKTRYGFVWKEGSELAHYDMLHRDTVSRMPAAVNTFREMAQLTEWLFRDTPIKDVRMGASSPRMLLEYVNNSYEDAVASFDSFGFYLSQADRNMPTDGLHFTPLSTPESWCQVGFLFPSRAKPSLRARHIVDILKKFLSDNCSEYFERYPLS